MPSYKLTYFPISARAELSRWIFAVAKQQYTDERIKWEDWPAMKANTPFGQLPQLTVDGTVLCQSHVIEEYLARTFKLAGGNDLEQAKAAMIVECCEDACKPLAVLRSEKDDAKKAEIKKKYTDEQLPGFLSNFEKLLKANGGGDGYFVGSKLTYADLAVVYLFEQPSSMFGIEVNLDNFPKLKALKAKVEKTPGLAEWLKNRPQNIFPPGVGGK